MNTAELDLTGPRLSSLAMGCPRQVYYQAVEAPKRAPTKREKRLWKRGHAVSNAVRDEIVSELREDGQAPRRELPIAWPDENPIGEGHADLWVPQDKRVVEITSTAGSVLQPHKVRQVAGYAHHHARAEEAFVCSVDPSTGEERWYPVNWEAVWPEMEDLEAELVSALDQGEAPTRRCSHPGDATGFFCHYADHCFSDWERPQPSVILQPAAVELVELLAAMDADVRKLDAESKALKQERDKLRDQLRPSVPAGEAMRAGDLVVKRGTYERSSFSLSQAAAAGHQLPLELEAFVSTSEVERWQPIKEAKT